MAFSRRRGQFTAPSSRSGRSYTYAGRRVLLRETNFQLNWNGPQVIAAMLNNVSSALSGLSDNALAYMQSIVPVDTGALRESCFVNIRIVNERMILAIGASAPYAVYVELGSARNVAKPFIRPTFDYIISQLPNLLRAEVSRRGR